MKFVFNSTVQLGEHFASHDVNLSLQIIKYLSNKVRDEYESEGKTEKESLQIQIQMTTTIISWLV